MKAIVSSTYDHSYLFFLPIISWCWNKLGVDVICFLPHSDYMGSEAKNQVPAQIIRDSLVKYNLRCELHYFDAPENKKATYAQCARLYAGCLDLPEEEVIITSDVDMAVFGNWLIKNKVSHFDIFGTDLTPPQQFPICYISAEMRYWKIAFNPENKSYQQCLDDQLGHEECENIRGNLWCRDQELAYKYIAEHGICYSWLRARPGTQFASNRVDRDDINWRSYVNHDLVDAHLWRPGYTDENFGNIIELLRAKYPEENLDWLIDYRNQYIKLL